MKITYEILCRLSRQYGDAFYLLDESRFRRNYTELLAAFCANYSNTHIAYSYKTNYTPQLCRIIQEEGGFAEVVSEMEYALAKRIGVDDANIYYNGPYKKAAILESVLLNGVHVNIDSIEEANQIAEIAGRHENRKFKVGIRCNYDIGNKLISRFGIDAESAQFDDVVGLLNKRSNIKISGLHCHFPDRTLETFAARADKMVHLIQSKVNWKLDYISMGGGYFGRIPEEFAREFAVSVPTFEEYGKIIGDRISIAYEGERKENKPMLLIEPGSALVSDTMAYVTRVVSLKQIRGRDVAILTGSSININPNVKGIKRPIKIFHDPGKSNMRMGNWDLTGYTCIENDMMYQGLREKLQIGDYIVFKNVGSYSIVFKPPFILPNVAIIGVNDKNNDCRVVKQAETFEDLFNTFFKN